MNAPDPPPSRAADDERHELLVELRQSERKISKQRAHLHRSIEYVSGTGAHEPDALDRRKRLIAEERTISNRRKALHQLITRLESGNDVASGELAEFL